MSLMPLPPRVPRAAAPKVEAEPPACACVHVKAGAAGERVVLPPHAVRMSALLMNMESVCGGAEDGAPPEELVWEHISAATLRKVIDYCTAVAIDKQEEPTFGAEGDTFESPHDFKKYLSAWHCAFIDIPLNEVGDLAHAALFMQMEGLLAFAGAKLVSCMTGQSVAGLRAMLEFPDDHTPEQDAELVALGTAALGRPLPP